MQDLDELKHVFFLICAEFEVKEHSVSSFYKLNNFKPCLTKQLLNMKVICPAQSLNFFSDLCSSSVTAALALMTVISL